MDLLRLILQLQEPIREEETYREITAHQLTSCRRAYPNRET